MWRYWRLKLGLPVREKKVPYSACRVAMEEEWKRFKPLRTITFDPPLLIHVPAIARGLHEACENPSGGDGAGNRP